MTMKDELLHDLKKCIVNLKTKTDLLQASNEPNNQWSLQIAENKASETINSGKEETNLLIDITPDDQNLVPAGDIAENSVSDSFRQASELESNLASNQSQKVPLNEKLSQNVNGSPNKNRYCPPHIKKLGIIRDSEPDLRKLCVMIEKVFRRGLRQQNTVFGIVKKDYWSWIELLAESRINVNPHLQIIVSKIKDSGKFLTAQGRGRCFIRAALNKKILALPIQLLYKSGELLYSLYDPLTAIFTNEDSREFIIGVFSLLNNMEFDLRIRNASFLDETWELPMFRQIELVPSEDLGLTIRYVQARALVVDLDEYGVAAEDGKVQVGDVLDEVHQVSVYDSKPGAIHQILQDHSGWPITIGVVKSRVAVPTSDRNSGGGEMEWHFFPPIEKRLNEVSRGVSHAFPKVKKLLDSQGKDQNGASVETTVCIEGKQYWRCNFIGKREIGSQGGSQLIEPTIQSMLKERQKKNDQQVFLAAYEADVTVLASRKDQSDPNSTASSLPTTTSDLLWNHSFPEISSCGRRVDSSECFAYIVGNDICNVATQFTAYLFEAPTSEISREILQNIAQGFKRTTWLT
ncbi:uncharacterized protein LOC134845164 isoform X1 [Symsagittifera roscoffensis]|uniref:uncharacterized protein LOC134845164 isoform X1 n=1 Tax=Symsagittifera roscoffensis TaxID=84072 RepID=UPI00307BDBEB